MVRQAGAVPPASTALAGGAGAVRAGATSSPLPGPAAGEDDSAGVPEATRARVAVLALMALATALRVSLVTRAYWVDEGISIGIASHPLSQIPGLLRMDGSPPLFYAILHLWLRLFGPSEVSTHLLSLSLSVLVVPVAWRCGGALFGPRAGRWAAVLAATNPFLAWYATETRMYPLVCGLAMVGVATAVRATERRSARHGVAAVLTFLALMYTHNWGIYLVAATAVVLGGLALHRRDWSGLRFVAGACVVVVVGYLPWLPTLLYQARHTAAPWAVSPSPGDLISDPASVLGGTLGVILVPLLVVGVAVTWRNRTRERDRACAVVGGVALLTMVTGWAAAQLEPSWTSRYLAAALGPALLAVAGALVVSRLGRRVMAVGAALLVVWSIVGSLLPDPNARYAKSNVAAVAAAARPPLAPGDLVVVTQTEQLAVVAHYLPPGLRFLTPTGPVTDARVVDWRDLISRLEDVDPCHTIAPDVDALPVGAHVLVVNPLRRVGAAGTRWSGAVSADVRSINQLLVDDPALSDRRALSPATRPRPFSAVTGLLFTKTAGLPACT